MKRLFASVSAILLSLSPALAQGMRDEHQSPQKCFRRNTGMSAVPHLTLCVNNSGTVAFTHGGVYGKINQRYRDEGSLREYYLEGGNLIQYSCHEDGTYMQCGTKPKKETYYPL